MTHHKIADTATQIANGDDRNAVRSDNELTINESIAQLMRSLARDFTRALERRLARHNVTISMWFPLRVLWEADGIYQHEIQRILDQAQPTVVNAIKQLEQQKLIRRHRRPNDRRRISIHLTSKGWNLKKDILHYAAEVQDRALENISGEEHQLLIDMFGRMRDSLKKDRHI